MPEQSTYTRHHKDWIDGFLTYTERGESPTLFKKWVAISTLATALERKVHTEWESLIYPNMFIVIIGPAGCRKGTAMWPAAQMVTQLGVKLSAQAVTREALIRNLVTCEKSIIHPSGETETHSSLTVYSEELAVFLGDRNIQLIRDLCDWYDCKDTWTYETVGRGEEVVQKLWVNLVGATTPTILGEMLTAEAIGGGFTSRCVFVYGDKKSQLTPRPKLTSEERALGTTLLEDLQHINTISGEFQVTEAYHQAYDSWYLSGAKSYHLSDYNFASYVDRRPQHIRKLSMIVSLSRSDELILEEQDFDRALSLLEGAEKHMPGIYRGFGKLDLAAMYPKVCQYLMRNGCETITYSQLVVAFHRDITPDELLQMLSVLKREGKVQVKKLDTAPGELKDWSLTYAMEVKHE